MGRRTWLHSRISGKWVWVMTRGAGRRNSAKVRPYRWMSGATVAILAFLCPQISAAADCGSAMTVTATVSELCTVQTSRATSIMSLACATTLNYGVFAAWPMVPTYIGTFLLGSTSVMPPVLRPVEPVRAARGHVSLSRVECTLPLRSGSTAVTDATLRSRGFHACRGDALALVPVIRNDDLSPVSGSLMVVDL